MVLWIYAMAIKLCQTIFFSASSSRWPSSRTWWRCPARRGLWSDCSIEWCPCWRPRNRRTRPGSQVAGYRSRPHRSGCDPCSHSRRPEQLCSRCIPRFRSTWTVIKICTLISWRSHIQFSYYRAFKI